MRRSAGSARRRPGPARPVRAPRPRAPAQRSAPITVNRLRASARRLRREAPLPAPQERPAALEQRPGGVRPGIRAGRRSQPPRSSVAAASPARPAREEDDAARAARGGPRPGAVDRSPPAARAARAAPRAASSPDRAQRLHCVGQHRERAGVRESHLLEQLRSLHQLAGGRLGVALREREQAEHAARPDDAAAARRAASASSCSRAAVARADSARPSHVSTSARG